MTAFRASGAVPARQLHDLRYADLVARADRDDRRASTTRFDLSLSAEAEARMRAYLAAKPKDKHGAHATTSPPPASTLAAERERFPAYQERYGVPSEV